MKHRWNLFLAVTTLVVLTALGTGCNTDEPFASELDAGVPASAPAYSELNAVLSLDDADAKVVKSALNDWRDEAPRGEMAFVATVTPVLDDAQLIKLVDFLVERREARRAEMRAQRKQRHDDGARMQRLADELDLTAEQQTALKALHTETRIEAKAQLDAENLTEEQRKEKIATIRETKREKLAAILTPDQLAKFDTMREARMERHLDRRIAQSGEHVDQRAQWLDSALGLSDSQAADVKAALTAMADTRKTSLEALKTEAIARDAAHDQMRAAHDKFEESLKGILTEAQQERLEILQRLYPRRLHHA